MEVIEIPQKEKRYSVSVNQKDDKSGAKCTKRYVQPPRTQPFMPQRAHCFPETPTDIKTVYCLSYIQDRQNRARPKPIRPENNINLPKDDLTTDTTTNMSYKPVIGNYKSKPIVPRQRLNFQKGSMECLTTVRRDFIPKHVQRPDKIVPCCNIRMSKSNMEEKTTTLLSYMRPGPVEPVESYKPSTTYCQSQEPMAQETTQKLSFMPIEIVKKENFPWIKKPAYKPPEEPMSGDTTYSESYLQCTRRREQLIIPKEVGIFPNGVDFFEKTIYKESFLPCQSQPVTPYIPCGNIVLPDDEMSSDTTNKVSFQRVVGEKRKPIVPRQRKLLGATGIMQDATTTRLAFTPKCARKTELIVPYGNIGMSKQPLEDKTTTALSYASPGPVKRTSSYKPDLQFCKSDKKFETETVNKLSYQQWPIGPKLDLPWARKPKYCPPSEQMAADSVTHASFPAPGYFVEDCPSTEENKIFATSTGNELQDLGQENKG